MSDKERGTSGWLKRAEPSCWGGPTSMIKQPQHRKPLSSSRSSASDWYMLFSCPSNSLQPSWNEVLCLPMNRVYFMPRSVLCQLFFAPLLRVGLTTAPTEPVIAPSFQFCLNQSLQSSEYCRHTTVKGNCNISLGCTSFNRLLKRRNLFFQLYVNAVC